MPIYRDIYDGPPHGYSDRYTRKRFIVVHNTANDATAHNEATYAKRRTDSVSSHYYADDSEVIQSLNTDLRAWHVGSDTGNDQGISYEITGTNGKGTTWWRRNVAWRSLAACIARDCAHWGIAARTLTVDQIQSGRHTGIITHNQARLAWGHTDHTDPGPNFPLNYLVDLAAGEQPPPPGPGKPQPPTTGDHWLEELMSNLPTVREGDTGKWVRRVQALCVAYGGTARREIQASGGIDGRFGPGTTRAVRAVQANAHPIDGIVGPITWAELIGG